MVGFAIQVLTHGSLDIFTFENGLHLSGLAKEKLKDQWFKVCPGPGRERYAKPRFRAMKYLPWDDVRESLLQYVFLCEPAYLETLWNRCGRLYEYVVKER